jgi:hypothetical protein
LRKKWILTGAIILLAIITAIVYFTEDYVKKVPLYEKADFTNVNNKESWRLFSKELKVSERKAKIQDFQLILDKQNRIYSIRFDLVDKNKDTFTVYHYSHCFSCEIKEENQVQISKSTVSEWLQYNKLVNANLFFLALDQLNQKDFFQDSKFEYRLLVSSGWTENRLVEGNYFLLKNSNLQKVDNKASNTISTGFNLQVIGSESPSNFSTDKDTTKIVFIDTAIE